MPRDGHPKHGHATKRFGLSPTYISWVAMKGRCLQPKNEKYPSYGGRGVTICDRWRTFVNFLADMGDRPEGKTLDRFPNRNGNYEPGNCRWATPQEQADNSDIEAKGWKRNITHCPAGHPYDETSLCSDGSRRCLPCNRIRQKSKRDEARRLFGSGGRAALAKLAALRASNPEVRP